MYIYFSQLYLRYHLICVTQLDSSRYHAHEMHIDHQYGVAILPLRINMLLTVLIGPFAIIQCDLSMWLLWLRRAA